MSCKGNGCKIKLEGNYLMNRIFRTGCFALLALVGVTTLCRADTLKFKDGTTLDGDIVSENDQTIDIRISFDQGTIVTRRTYAKDEVAEIIRLSPEEKKKQKMEYWYGKVKLYQLNPKTSYAQDYYDSVITGVFKRYLTVFPTSSHDAKIADQMAAWQAERDQVAAGQVKRNSQWMTQAQADQLTVDQKALGYLDSGRNKLSVNEFRLAWLDVSQGYSMTKNPDVVKQVGQLQNDIYFKYTEYLMRQINWLKVQIDYKERSAARANVASASASQQPVFNQPDDLTSPSGDPRVRRSPEELGDALKAQAARADETVDAYKQRLAQVQAELDQLKQKKAEFDAGAEVGGMKKVE